MQGVHPVQKMMDNPWLLLVVGLVIPGVSYTLWGWFEWWNIPPALLP
jgi:hypothetical protein